MYWNKLSAGKDIPNDINVLIEIPIGGEPVKYELDKESGTLSVDRILSTAMRYPGNYGFIPQTLGNDGDPLDVLIICDTPLVPGSVMSCRPIGVLNMSDEAGEDEKIIAVPNKNISRMFDDVLSLDDFPEYRLKQIVHFFENYKGLEVGKWVKVSGWGALDQAKALILDGLQAASRHASADGQSSKAAVVQPAALVNTTVLTEQARLMRAAEQGLFERKAMPANGVLIEVNDLPTSDGLDKSLRRLNVM